MRVSTVLFALISSAVAAPAATSTATPTAAGLSPAPTANGAPCECGQAPNFVYSRCMVNVDGTHSIWNCMPGSPTCSWMFVANGMC